MKKRRKPPAMPKWYWWDTDGCWFCKNKTNCNNCPFAKKYRKKYFAKKVKGQHSRNKGYQ